MGQRGWCEREAGGRERGWWEREAGVGGIGARVIVEGERLLCEREMLGLE